MSMLNSFQAQFDKEFLTRSEIARTEYAGVELVDIPSGMGGVFPAAVLADHGDEIQVVCLHGHYYTDWVLTVKRADTRACTYTITRDMKRIIDSRRRR